MPLTRALGAILAHSEMAGRRKIAKGTELTAEHLELLGDAGLAEVTVAVLEPGDVHEDAAAARLAGVLHAGSGLALSDAATGRVNLRATGPGVLQIDVDAIRKVNRIDPGITVATVPEFARLGPRGLAATIKIIPYAVPGAALDRACEAAGGALRFRTPVIATATLIETRTDDRMPSEKGRRAMKERLAFFGAELGPRVVVPHEEGAIAEALEAATGELLMILTGSATSDFRDTAPQAVRRAGGQVAHYGMPVDPGNLLFLGALGNRSVIGLPGCARSPALNGADWVLERLVCGLDVDAEHIMDMGVGGLLKEIPSRPSPRGKVDPPT